MSIKICHITSMHEWDDDRIYQRACLGLVREGYSVHLVATTPSSLPKTNKVQLHWLKQRTGWKRRWFSSKEAVDKAIGVNADIYHFHDPDLLPHILKIKKTLPKAKIVYDIHENYAARFKQWGLPTFLGNIFRDFEHKTIKKIDAFTVVSEAMAQLFIDTNKPFAVTRNSVDTLRLESVNLKESIPYFPPAIYTSGTNSHSRQCIETVHSMKYLKDRGDFQMIFAGRYLPGIKEELMVQAQNDGTDKYLHLEDMLPWDENFKRTAKAFCGCVFYENNENNKIGIPNRLFEYMYCGIPIIATDFPELRKIVESTKCGILVDTDHPEEIAKAIEYLLENPIEAKKMGENGRKAIENNYGYHIDLKNTIEFYKKLLY